MGEEKVSGGSSSIRRDVVDIFALYKDFPPFGPITEIGVNLPANRSTDDMRIATGRMWTYEEYEARRKRVLSTPFP